MGVQWNNFIGGTSLVCVMHEWNARFWITGLLYHFPDKLGVQGKRGGSRRGSKVGQKGKIVQKELMHIFWYLNCWEINAELSVVYLQKKKLQFYCLTYVDHLYFHKHLF